MNPSPSNMDFDTILWVGGFSKSSLSGQGFEANAELAGFWRNRRRNFEEMQLIFKFNKQLVIILKFFNLQFNNYYITILNVIFLIILNYVFMENQICRENEILY